MKEYSWLKYSGFTEYTGWQELLEDTFEEIDKYIKEEEEVDKGFSISYIKEKYGGISFEWSGGDDVITDILLDAENISHNICQKCGHYGKTRDGGRLTTLCNKCYEENNTMKTE